MWPVQEGLNANGTLYGTGRDYVGDAKPSCQASVLPTSSLCLRCSEDAWASGLGSRCALQSPGLAPSRGMSEAPG